jgi:hypothetical protein
VGARYRAAPLTGDVMGRFVLFLLAIAGLVLAQPADAQSRKSLTRDGFTFPAQEQVRIVLFRPDVTVSEQSTGGLDQPNAGWTDEARDQLTTALGKAQAERNIELKLMPDLEGADAKFMSDYKRLFKSVADNVIKHRLFDIDPLPTKVDRFDWTLGEGAAKLGALGNADYGLFFYTLDSYESASRRTARILAASIGAAPTEVNMGYAGLVDLKTGDLVWINVDVKMGGDVRTADGATYRISELLDGFPVRTGFVVPPAKAVRKKK